MGSLAKWGAWLLGGCVLALGAWFAINATDEALSDEARATMVLPPLPAPDRDNGFLDFLVLSAPAGAPTFETGLEQLAAYNNQSGGELAPPPWGYFKADPRLRTCTFGGEEGGSGDARGCFQAAREPWVPAALEAQAAFLGRYRAMRDKPRFVNIISAKSPENSLPAYVEPLEAQRLVLLGAARRFQAGDRLGAVREVERDAAFYRRMALDATTLIDKMIAFAALDRVALFVTELARHGPRGDAALWRELEAVVRALTRQELDVMPSLRRAVADHVRWMQTRQYVRLSDASWETLRWSGKTRPWWDPLAPYLYRPHQTVNRCAARYGILAAVAERPPTEYFDAAKAARARAQALDPGLVQGLIVNPAGLRHPLNGECEVLDYIGRMHGRAAVQTLARLQVNLRARGITGPQDIEAQLAGPLGAAHANPFSGQPMRYDASTRTLGFDVEQRYLSGAVYVLYQRYGRMALPL